MSPRELSNLQLRLARWQRQQGTVRVVAGITAFSVLVSALISYGAFFLAYGGVADVIATVDAFGLALPIIVPLVVAPAASAQVTSALATASDLIDELEKAHHELRNEIERRHATQLELERLVRSDPLTGLLNRRGFFDALASLRSDQLATLLLATVDVDRFKSVNDEYGHAMGDQVLCAVGHALRAAAGDDAIVARMGGDEFVVALVNGSSTLGDVRAVLEDVEVPAASDGPVRVRCSIGSATHVAGRSIDLTLAEADLALYRDKPSWSSHDQTRSSAS